MNVGELSNTLAVYLSGYYADDPETRRDIQATCDALARTFIDLIGRHNKTEDTLRKHDQEFGGVYTRLSNCEGENRGTAGLLEALRQEWQRRLTGAEDQIKMWRENARATAAMVEGFRQEYAAAINSAHDQARLLSETINALQQQHARQLAAMAERIDRLERGRVPTLLRVGQYDLNLSGVNYFWRAEDGQVFVKMIGSQNEDWDLSFGGKYGNQRDADLLRDWLDWCGTRDAAHEVRQAQAADEEAQR